LARHARFRYRAAYIPRRRGGIRSLLIPDERLKFLQRKLLELLEPLYFVRSPVHGFVKGKGAISNADAHQARPYLLNIDIENFFGTISRARVLGVLRSLGLPLEVAEAVTALCVTHDQLPQGAPTSPLLANMVCFRLDRQLLAFAAEHRLRFTRYADDITLSGYTQPIALFDGALPPPGAIGPEALSDPLRSIFRNNGFNINRGKVRFADRKHRKEVTGLVVNEFTNVRRTFVRNIRSSLHRVELLGLEQAQAEFAARYKADATLQDVIRGRLDWLAQVRGRSFSAYRSLAARYNAVFPSRPIRIDPTPEEIATDAVFVIEFCSDDTERSAQGTAFLFEGVGLVTAHHVVEQLEGDEADIFRPHTPAQRFKAKLTAKRCAHRDIAILSHDIPPDHEALLRPATTVLRREGVVALGFPAFGPGDVLAETTGSVVALPTKGGVKMVQVSVPIAPGMSGGPIINERYEVVAVVHKGGHKEAKQLGVHITEILKLRDE